MDDTIIVTCPSCKNYIEIKKKEINCAIFRHAIYKNTMLQIDPHTPKDKCDHLFQNNLIYGCSKPFKLIIGENNTYETIVCDYI
jgi:hypothetical protein